MPDVRRRWAVAALTAFLLAPRTATAQADTPPDPLAGMDAAVAAAEASLSEGEFQLAESHYRSALAAGWLVMGGLDAAERRWDDAARAFERASTVTVFPRDGVQSLALVHIQTGRPQEAVDILTRLVGMNKKDIPSRRLLAQALAAAGQQGEAVQELEEAAATAADDAELQFLLASGYLQLGRVEDAERLFAKVAAARPLAATYVLIGRTYRDSGQYERGRQALRKALSMDPRAQRAHYYLGSIAVMEEGLARLDEAIAEFQQELTLNPGDPVTSLRLGMALVEARRSGEACPLLETAASSEPAPPDAFYYLGRCHLDGGRPADAANAFRRALALAGSGGHAELDASRARHIHYQLATALRRAGKLDEAARHFDEAERASARVTDAARDDLARYLADTPRPEALDARAPVETAFPLASWPADRRATLRRRAANAIARGYFNLGVMHVQRNRSARAAEFLAQAADVDPAFPNVHYSLGIAYFNAGRHADAAPALERAVAADPSNGDAQRMLALAWLNAGAAPRAAELLRNDPRRDTDPSLQYAFGLALMRSNRPQDALLVFSQLRTDHGSSPELDVVEGQAHAQHGDYDAAIAAFERAIAAKPDVPEAHAALGVIYLKQGRLPEAAAALRAELAIAPSDVPSRHNLATVLDLQGERSEATALLRAVLGTQPDYADARYLLGKILLAQGEVAEAVEHLETAARLAPADANVHYQLAQAYTKAGREELAQGAFETFRKLKDERAGRTP